jgi:hypothetical protein
MNGIYRFVWRRVFGPMARAGYVRPFLFIYSRVITQVNPSDGSASPKAPTVFALNSERFRGDLEVLADSKKFRVLKIPFDWQVRLLNLFWPEDIEPLKKSYFNPGNDPVMLSIQKDIEKFFKRFLPALYRELKIDCVIGAAKHYLQDFDWGRVSNDMGFPYIVLHRENLASAPKHYQAHVERGKRLNNFRGSHIVVHNEVVRNALIASGFVSEDRISALGCLRMDDYVRKVKTAAEAGGAEKPGPPGDKKVVLFSFHHGMGLTNLVPSWPKDPDAGFRKLFEQVHTAFAEVALSNPSVDFIIKPKWGGNWEEEIDKALRKSGLDYRDVPNLHLIVETDVHELILSSDVICGFQSTTMLEGAIAGKPVIVPYFEEALRPEYGDYIHFRDSFHLFDIADSKDKFASLITERLKNSHISPEIMAERNLIFEKYVSSMDGDSLDKYAYIINKIVDKGR